MTKRVRKRLIPNNKSGMRNGYARWRDRAVLFINDNGPSSVDMLLSDMRNAKGRMMQTSPTRHSASNIMRFDKRFVNLGKEEVKTTYGTYDVNIYDIDYANEEVIKMIGGRK
tara:strand:+ start:199 stop:534 length:336 start_codon:yes stop_codon:yes gene_type:complete